jgi:DnaD/phage-associated family protein
MPYAPDREVKVYIYGLFLCVRADMPENEQEGMAAALSLTPADIINSYGYWQELGLVHILKKEPPEVRYLPVRSGMSVLKRIKPSKYADFNLQLQDMTTGRMISANEYNEYYNTMETTGFTQEAMLLTARYCYALKGGGLNYPYVLTVARNWAAEGIKTAAEVEERLAEYAAADSDLTEILRTLKIRRKADLEDRQLYLKWTKKLDFGLDAVLFCARSLKGKGGLERLDARLAEYYEKRLTNVAEMEAYIEGRQSLMETAKNVAKILGVFYEDLEYVADTYLLEWRKRGFADGTLLDVADALFKNDIRRLSRMNKIVNELADKGATEPAAAAEYIKRLFAPRSAAGTGKEKGKPFAGRDYKDVDFTKLFDDPEKIKM